MAILQLHDMNNWTSNDGQSPLKSNDARGLKLEFVKVSRVYAMLFAFNLFYTIVMYIVQCLFQSHPPQKWPLVKRYFCHLAFACEIDSHMDFQRRTAQPKSIRKKSNRKTDGEIEWLKTTSKMEIALSTAITESEFGTSMKRVPFRYLLSTSSSTFDEGIRTATTTKWNYAYMRNWREYFQSIPARWCQQQRNSKGVNNKIMKPINLLLSLVRRFIVVFIFVLHQRGKQQLLTSWKKTENNRQTNNLPIVKMIREKNDDDITTATVASLPLSR